jgi:hypothetical protein
MRRIRRLSFFLLGFERGGNHDKVGGMEVYLGFMFQKYW